MKLSFFARLVHSHYYLSKKIHCHAKFFYQIFLGVQLRLIFTIIRWTILFYRTGMEDEKSYEMRVALFTGGTMGIGRRLIAGWLV